MCRRAPYHNSCINVIDNKATDAAVREMVAHFADRTSFDDAVTALRQAGFETSDLSVLATHESLGIADKREGTWQDAMIAALGEWKMEVPLIASGAVLLAGGPAAAAVAGIIGATVGGIAVKEVIQEVTAQSHAEDFAKAVEAGNIVLWVRVADRSREATARDILVRTGGGDVHLTESNNRQH